MGEGDIGRGGRRGGRGAPENANSLRGRASLRGHSRGVGVRRGGPRGGVEDIERGGRRFVRRGRTGSGGLTRHWGRLEGLARTPSGNPGSKSSNGVNDRCREKSPQPKRWWWYENKKGW